MKKEKGSGSDGMELKVTKFGATVIGCLVAGIIAMGTWAFTGVCEENKKQDKQISRKVDNATLQQMIKAQDPKALAETFISYTGVNIPLEVPSQKSLLHVFVQDEHIFEEILAALSGLETGSLAVLDAESHHKYLSQIPLYADFANQKDNPVCRVILAIVEQSLDNEIIRRIESVTGSLRECSGVMVTIQNLIYAAGSLAP